MALQALAPRGALIPPIPYTHTLLKPTHLGAEGALRQVLLHPLQLGRRHAQHVAQLLQPRHLLLPRLGGWGPGGGRAGRVGAGRGGG